MEVLKVVAEGVVTSFRYPHFMQTVHPSFPMPPPATIYGHICSALGEWVDPAEVQFAYHFISMGRIKDKEHIIMLTPAGGKLPGTAVPKVLEGNVNPFERDLLFQPCLTLYLNRPEWATAFRCPRYTVVLGRSQDLFTYTEVSVVDLERADRAYFEHTLLPHAMALHVQRGTTLLMPRFLDYEHNRAPQFARYVALEERVMLPPEASDETYYFSHMTYGPYWVDPTTPEVKGARRGVMFLSFTGEVDDKTFVA